MGSKRRGKSSHQSTSDNNQLKSLDSISSMDADQPTMANLNPPRKGNESASESHHSDVSEDTRV